MSAFLVGVDMALCVLIVLAALDYLRAVFALDRPIECVSFYVVAIGAFLMILSLADGHVPSMGSVLIHLGVVIYCTEHYSQIFEQHWRWDGYDRRHSRG